MLKNAFANFKLNERGKRLFGGLLLIYGLYVLPILLSGRAFKDDNPRLLYGYTGWADGDGRPLTEFIIE
ncbi:MAG: hypothetical protein HUJ70_06525, partial [Pseudobutyrivibrio sp.]|nr:hypothetical protein [Pseudobutyrivibrio sp.]